MEPIMFDNVTFEKENAIARFNHFSRIAKCCRIFEVVIVLGLISWSSARVPTILRIFGCSFVGFTSCLFNHHIVFLIGNAIIVLLFVLFRQNDDESLRGHDNFYDDYVEHNEVVHQREHVLPPLEKEDKADETVKQREAGDVDEEKQIMVVREDMKVIPQCDDVEAAIERATKQIKRFERTQSEKLKREIAVRPRRELRRSQTEKCPEVVDTADRGGAESKIEALSNEEFRRTVDAFIDKHWSNRKRIMYC